MTLTPAGVQRFLRRLIVLFGVVAAVLAVVSTMKQRRPHASGSQPLPLADYGAVTPFSLTDQNGKTVTLDSLSGTPWIADFIFTRCAGPCPTLSFQMSKLQQEFLKISDVRFVSFSVDPAYDTPTVLKTYAAVYKADNDRWLFLTGNTQKVYELISKSFRLAVEKNMDPNQKPGEQVNHSLFFVLVGRDGRINGYYNSTDREAMERLRKDIGTLSSNRP